MAEEVFWLRRTTGEPPAGVLLGPAPDPLPEWVIGDTHWGHDRMVHLCGRPPDHDWLMLERWRATVRPGDRVLHVGDVCWRPADWLGRLAELPGEVFLIRGNHDSRSRSRQYEGIGWKVVEPFEFERRGWRVLVTHRPESRLPARTLNLHGHVHNNPSEGLTRRNVNVSAEVVDYRPAALAALLDERVAELATAASGAAAGAV